MPVDNHINQFPEAGAVEHSHTFSGIFHDSPGSSIAVAIVMHKE
jgi:hypothetical protein